MNVKEKILQRREEKNKKLIHVSLEMETSTHFPMLMKAIQLTNGPVLEIGSGLFSTPLLHWMCFKDKRSLTTIESYEHYLEFAKEFETDWHKVQFLPPTEAPTPEKYSVVFVDHSPKKPRTRGSDALLFKDSDYIVLHDGGVDANPKYGYQEIYSQFKYVYHWNDIVPNTTVLSNFHELTNFSE